MTKNFELFFSRIKKAAGASSDKELCDLLDLNKSTLSMWKKREKVDYELLFMKFEDINFHWLLTGEGGMPKGSEKKDEKLTEDSTKDQLIETQAKLIKQLEKQVQQMERELHRFVKDYDKSGFKEQKKTTYGYKHRAPSPH